MAVESIAGQEDPGSSLTTEESGEQYTTDKYGNRIRVDAGRYLDDYGNPLLAWGWGDPLPQGVVDFAAGFGDTLSFGGTAAFRELWNGNRVVDFDSGEYYGGVASGVAVHVIGFRRGAELSIGRNFRLAPWGNRTGYPTGRYPHYHRRAVDSKTGQTVPGGSIKRHRPWDGRSSDKSIRDRF